MHSDGTADHAGDSRWKAGAGTAGIGAFAGLAKFGLLSLIFKLYWLWALIHLMVLGGGYAIAGAIGIVVLVAGTLLGYRRRLWRAI